jgi:hypothetical protein
MVAQEKMLTWRRDFYRCYAQALPIKELSIRHFSLELEVRIWTLDSGHAHFAHLATRSTQPANGDLYDIQFLMCGGDFNASILGSATCPCKTILNPPCNFLANLVRTARFSARSCIMSFRTGGHEEDRPLYCHRWAFPCRKPVPA